MSAHILTLCTFLIEHAEMYSKLRKGDQKNLTTQ